MDHEDQEQGARIVPWLYCSAIERSTAFYCDVLGFTLRGRTPEEKSAYIEYRGARLMLQETGPSALLAGSPEYPFGRGVHLLLETLHIDALYSRVLDAASDVAVFIKPRNKWYRVGEDMVGHREFVIKDPDGYLLRFYQPIEGLEDA